ncbi:Alpha/beta hydrolase psoB [Colletotrichum trifolii]|uniref:Alpha/beta hydrolase psoB n=1 Tax=Colletotrichum trifolii TaxID=5466 RepID=A0A4V3HTT3_COLTR|nr:Alpha/beta hydrolase psoB [Colletotrichum trifolii]
MADSGSLGLSSFVGCRVPAPLFNGFINGWLSDGVFNIILGGLQRLDFQTRWEFNHIKWTTGAATEADFMREQLRCTGERDGCHRCKRMRTTCTYAAPARRNRERDRYTSTSTTTVEKNGNRPPSTPENEYMPDSAFADAMDMQKDSIQCGYLTADGSDHMMLGKENTHVNGADRVHTSSGSCDSAYGDASNWRHSTPSHQPETKGLENWLVTPTDVFLTDADFASAELLSTSTLSSANSLQQSPMMVTTVDSAAPDPEESIRAGYLAHDDSRVSRPRSSAIIPAAQQQDRRDPSVTRTRQVDRRRRRPSRGDSREEKGGDCTCLQPVVFMLDELETEQSAAVTRGVDSALASVKEALNHCRGLLCCPRCRSRPEHVTVLTMLADKLARLCGLIVAEFRRDVGGGGDEKRPPFDLCLGQYEIDAEWEWVAVVGGLIGIQLQALLLVTDKIRELARELQVEYVCAKSGAIRERVALLLARKRP